jgi:hypothetical protein
MATQKTAPVAKKAAPVKKAVTTFSCQMVEKNKYEDQMADLAKKGAKILAITVNPDMRNSFDVHYSVTK